MGRTMCACQRSQHHCALLGPGAAETREPQGIPGNDKLWTVLGNACGANFNPVGCDKNFDGHPSPRHCHRFVNARGARRVRYLKRQLSSRDMGSLAGIGADKVGAVEKRENFVASLLNRFAAALLAIHQGQHERDLSSFTLNRVDGLKG